MKFRKKPVVIEAITFDELVAHGKANGANIVRGMPWSKPVVIEAITFDELVAHGKANGANIVRGMPWSFQYEGQPITHENDECYLIPTLEGTMKFGPGDMLITGVKGEIYPCKLDIFAATYDPVPDHHPV